jgi:hypothetical protein
MLAGQTEWVNEHRDEILPRTSTQRSVGSATFFEMIDEVRLALSQRGFTAAKVSHSGK